MWGSNPDGHCLLLGFMQRKAPLVGMCLSRSASLNQRWKLKHPIPEPMVVAWVPERSKTTPGPRNIHLHLLIPFVFLIIYPFKEVNCFHRVLQEFISLAFHEFGLSPPSPDEMYQLYLKFDEELSSLASWCSLNRPFSTAGKCSMFFVSSVLALPFESFRIRPGQLILERKHRSVSQTVGF